MLKQFRAGVVATVVSGLLAFGYLFARYQAEHTTEDLSASTPVDQPITAPAPSVVRSSSSDTGPAPVRPAALTDDTFEQLLASSPRLAAAEVADLPEATELRDHRLARLIEVWVAQAPNEAVYWANQLPSGDFRNEAMQELGAAWGRVDTLAAARWASDSLTAGQPIPASSLLSVWGRNDPAAAAEWLSALSETEDTTDSPAILARLSGALTYAWSTTAPEAAAQWVAAQNTSPMIRSQAIVNLAAGWAENDPGGLAAWLKIHVQPNSAEAQAAYATLASHWADSHADSAGAWATALPSGNLRDTTLATFASSLATSEPESALRWTQAIESPSQRQEAVLDIYETWLDDDLPAAREAIVTTIPTLEQREYQRALYNLLHEKDPVFRDELYNLILPNQEQVSASPPASQSLESTRPTPTTPPSSIQPEIRRALPANEDPVDVKAMAP